ncbi:MAG: diphosphate--fructose-6-phosphate 1-phosphotransferase [Clostridiales Family XIII bacterium]|nr:diphosphate--fructose-6-phosphate 1-phosphotransferase [Clostridiales Family XIII bacterium]
MSRKRNALVALGGGPSPVINASLLGIIEGCGDWPDDIDTVYGAVHGIEGVLLENLIALSGQDRTQLQKLRYTPASGAIGTCRYKLQAGAEDDYRRVVEVARAHNIGYFFYIGGNDSMDTAQKVSRLAHEMGIDLIVAGVPKTIDNDLGDEARTMIDHTPGYGSTARYWAMLMKDLEEENRGMCVSEPVSVIQAMGRKSGFITAASRLADPNRQMPLQLYFAETEQNIDSLYENVKRCVKECGRCIVVVNEGFNAGDIGEEKDGFGHMEYGANTAAAQLVAETLNTRGLPVRGLATWQMPGVLQRCTSVFRSAVDVDEAYEVGRYAVGMAMREGTGYMATILRDRDSSAYKAYFDKISLEIIADSVRYLPPEWIAEDGLDVTDDFISYAMPLIGRDMDEVRIVGGLQDFAVLDERRIDRKCPDYIPYNFR